MRKIIFLFTSFLLLIDIPIKAQWVQIGPPGGGQVWSFAVSGSNIFAGTIKGVYLSTNNGSNWGQPSLTDRTVSSLTVCGSNVIAGTAEYGIYLSTNNGSTWTQTSYYYYDVPTLEVSGSYVFAGTVTHGVLISTDCGVTWSQSTLNNRAVFALGNKRF